MNRKNGKSIIPGLKDALKRSGRVMELRKLNREWRDMKRRGVGNCEEMDRITGRIREIVHYECPELRAIIMEESRRRSSPWGR